MVKGTVCAIKLCFRDREDRRAYVTTYALSGSEISEVYVMASQFASVLQGISNGLVVKIQISYHWHSSEETSIYSGDKNRKLLFLAANEDEDINAIVIPWPADVFEKEGDYKDIRIDLQDDRIIAFIAWLESNPISTRDGRDFGHNNPIGGLML